MMRRSSAGLLLLAGLAFFACDKDPSDPVEISELGEVRGSAFIDVNGNLQRDPADVPLTGLGIDVYVRNTNDLVTSTVTGGDGSYRITEVPPAEYDVRVDPATVPDTLGTTVVLGSPARVQSLDTAFVDIAAGFPIATIAEARVAPVGRRVFIDAVALNAKNAYPDGSVYVSDATGSIRLTDLGGGVLDTGDRGRFLGVLTRRDGQPTLDDVSFFVTSDGPAPVPVDVSTSVAGNAAGGDLDAALVRVMQATVTSTQVVGNEYRFTVNDGSGSLEAVVAIDRGFELALLVPGTELTIRGILVPTTGIARWQLRPRTPDDVSLGFPTVTITEARSLPVGSRVIILGTALNSRDAFPDTTVHIADGTGAIRGTRIRPGTVLAGDRARFLGTIATRDGQRTIDDVTVFVLGVGTLPAATPLNTSTAATASNGIFDAAQIQVRQVTVSDTATSGLYLRIGVNDGTGRLDVMVRKSGNFAFSSYVPGAILDVTGLLVPESGGIWRLRARTNADIRVNN